MDIASAVSPPIASRITRVDRLVPLAVPHVANVAVVLSGVLLLFLAGQLVRGKRRAWQLAVVLMLASVALHVIKGLDVEEASVSAALAAGLVVARRNFRAGSDAPSFRRLVRSIPLLAALPFAYGLLGLYFRRGSVGGWPGFAAAAAEVARRLVALSGPLHYSGRFGTWFPTSLTAVGVLSGAWIAYLAFRSVVVRPPKRTEEGERLLRELIAESPDSLGYFQLRDDKAAFVADGCAVGYAVVGGVALVASDPLGPAARWSGVVAQFAAFAHEHGWRVAALATTETGARTWADLGYRTLYLGDEAVIDTATWTIDGPRMRKVRQMTAQVARLGYTAEWYLSKDVPPDLQRALLHISEGWRGDDAEAGFTMSLGRLFDARDPDCLVAVARDAGGFARGFLHFVPVGQGSYSLDVMRRDRDAFVGLNDFLIVRTIQHCRDVGVPLVSLNFAFLRGIIRPVGRQRPTERLQRWLANRLGPWFQIESLYRFNSKFAPMWVPRFAAYESAMSVPSVLLAALRAEKLLDFGSMRRRSARRRAA
jgi:lysyl-tRNA synthetase class 2